MATKQKSALSTSTSADGLAKLREQYGCGPVQFTGTDNALYERHLIFDNVVKLAGGRPPGTIRGVRPLRAGHPLAALGAYGGHLRAREPQTHLLSLDGVSHRPLAGQQCDESARSILLPSKPSSRRTSIGSACSNRNPTRAWVMGGSGVWRPVSSTRWPRCNSRPWATDCVTNTACFARPSRTAGSRNSRTTGSVARTPGRSRALTKR